MTEYYTQRKQGKLFVHSVWRGSWFIAVQFFENRKIVPFSPFMDTRFKSAIEADTALHDYAEAHHLEQVIV